MSGGSLSHARRKEPTSPLPCQRLHRQQHRAAELLQLTRAIPPLPPFGSSAAAAAPPAAAPAAAAAAALPCSESGAAPGVLPPVAWSDTGWSDAAPFSESQSAMCCLLPWLARAALRLSSHHTSSAASTTTATPPTAIPTMAPVLRLLLLLLLPSSPPPSSPVGGVLPLPLMLPAALGACVSATCTSHKSIDPTAGMVTTTTLHGKARGRAAGEAGHPRRAPAGPPGAPGQPPTHPVTARCQQDQSPLMGLPPWDKPAAHRRRQARATACQPGPHLPVALQGVADQPPPDSTMPALPQAWLPRKPSSRLAST